MKTFEKDYLTDAMRESLAYVPHINPEDVERCTKCDGSGETICDTQCKMCEGTGLKDHVNVLKLVK